MRDLTIQDAWFEGNGKILPHLRAGKHTPVGVSPNREMPMSYTKDSI